MSFTMPARRMKRSTSRDSLLGKPTPAQNPTTTGKRHGRIRIRESLNKLRCQRQSDFIDPLEHPSMFSVRPSGSKAVPAVTVNPKRNLVRKKRLRNKKINRDDAEFLDRYAVTVLHTQITSEVSWDDDIDNMDRSHTGDKRVSIGGDNGSRMDTIFNDLDTINGDTSPDEWTLDESLSWEEDDTTDNDGSATLPSVEPREKLVAGVVDEVVDAISDFTYFFRCLSVETQRQLSNTTLQCGG